MRQHILALIDCDSFYVSCERKDNPSLQGKPVCVMTGGGNKGIIVSRSKEAKALGIKMGAPYFQVKNAYRMALLLLMWLITIKKTGPITKTIMMDAIIMHHLHLQTMR